MEFDLQPARRSPKYGTICICVSLGIVALWGAYAWFKWSDIVALKPNEVGDLLSGVLGPLAILWLILGFFQQSEELRHSVKALELQSVELRNSVEQQAALVEVTRAQAEAELTALQEERQARRASISPRFTVHAAGGSQSGNMLSQNLMVHNVGARASDVRIIIKSGARVFLDRFLLLFEEGDRENLEIDYTVDQRPDQMSVNILCKNRFGDQFTQLTRLKADPGNLMIFHLDEREKFEE